MAVKRWNGLSWDIMSGVYPNSGSSFQIGSTYIPLGSNISSLTGISTLDSLLYGTQWTGKNISYSFINSGSYFSWGYPENNIYLD